MNKYHNSAYDLKKFIDAQDSIYSGNVTMYQQAFFEIKSGRKYGHWIWYIFPQLEGLGKSSMCRLYGIAGKEGACEYLRNGILCHRLIEISEVLLANETNELIRVMSNNIDVMKVRSCITLFYIAALEVFGSDSYEAGLFVKIKNKYFEKIGFCDETLKTLWNNGEIGGYVY